jgi:hypothetical protein
MLPSSRDVTVRPALVLMRGEARAGALVRRS